MLQWRCQVACPFLAGSLPAALVGVCRSLFVVSGASLGPAALGASMALPGRTAVPCLFSAGRLRSRAASL
eukprot:12415756-Karenia_brevis.AAC.1